MVCESKIVEISMIGYVYIRNILGIECSLLEVFDPIIIFLISYPTASESRATFRQTISQTEVVHLNIVTSFHLASQHVFRCSFCQISKFSKVDFEGGGL